MTLVRFVECVDELLLYLRGAFELKTLPATFATNSIDLQGFQRSKHASERSMDERHWYVQEQ